MRALSVIGYVRVSTDKQDIGPEVQVAALRAEAGHKGWALDLRREDAVSAKSLIGRPVLARALADLKAGRADMLAVSKLDRLSRNVADFARLLEDSDREGWHLACLDLAVDTSSTTGRAMAHVTAAFAEMERRRIGERTREGMARIKAETGKHMGRPPTVAPAAVVRIRELRTDGLTLQAICDQLALDGIPTSSGGRWWPATVRQILNRTEGRDQ